MSALDAFARKSRLWNDEYLVEQIEKGPEGYADTAFFNLIQAEAARRGLGARSPALPPPLEPVVAPPPASGPFLARLWQGDVPLAETYWGWGVGCNVLLTILIWVVAGIDTMIAYALVWPATGYNFFMFVAIWRSAGRYSGPSAWAVLARISVGLGIANTVWAILGPA